MLIIYFPLHMQVYRPYRATRHDMCRFHAEDYIDFLQRYTTQYMRFDDVINTYQYSIIHDDMTWLTLHLCLAPSEWLLKTSLVLLTASADSTWETTGKTKSPTPLSGLLVVLCLLCPSPVFPGLYDFCSIYTGASLEGSAKLNNGVSWQLIFIMYTQRNLHICGGHVIIRPHPPGPKKRAVTILPNPTPSSPLRTVTSPWTGQAVCTMQRNSRYSCHFSWQSPPKNMQGIYAWVTLLPSPYTLTEHTHIQIFRPLVSAMWTTLS